MEKGIYTLGITGILHADKEFRSTGKIEVYLNDEWVELPPVAMVEVKENELVYTEREVPGKIIGLDFTSYEDLAKISAIRVTGIVLDDRNHKILHVVRSTIGVSLIEEEGKRVYGIGVYLVPPYLKSKRDTQEEFWETAVAQHLIYEHTHIITYTDGPNAEFKNFEHEEEVKKILLDKETAFEVLKEQCPEARDILLLEDVDRFNFTERKLFRKFRPAECKENIGFPVEII